MRLGSAFQKVNFLRDVGTDVNHLGRRYFPEMAREQFDEQAKENIIASIGQDFTEARKGIRELPRHARLPVSVAYFYYLTLLRKLKKTPASKLLTTRIRTSNFRKWLVLLKSLLLHYLRIL